MVTGAERITFVGQSLPAGAVLSETGLFQGDIPADANVWYPVVVQARDADGNVDVRRYQLLCNQDAPALSPQELRIEKITPSTMQVVVLGAADVSGVPRYQLERNGAVVGNRQPLPNFTNHDLVPNTRYTFRARAVDASPAAHRSNWMDVVTAWTSAAVPGYLSLADLTDTSVRIASLDTNGNPAGTQYTLYNATTGRYVTPGGTSAAVAQWQSLDVWMRTTVRDKGATDSGELAAEVRAFGGKVEISSAQAPTGMDRVAQFARAANGRCVCGSSGG